MPIGSDVDFFGMGAGGGYGGGYLPSLLQPWMRGGGQGGGSPYVGYSSFLPETSVVPATARGFVEQYIPELGGLENLGGQLGGGVRDAFQQFRFGGGAMEPGAAQGFANTLLEREDIQQLLRQSELQDEGAFLRSQNAQGATSLADIVAGSLGNEDSQIQNLYGATGFKQEQITEDLRRFAAGEESGLGYLSSEELFGHRKAGHTSGSRQAILAQLLGGQGLVDVGGGQTFNPYSFDILSDEYSLSAGRGGDISGRNVLHLGGGILSMQNADISSDVARSLSAAQLTPGAGGYSFGGERGHLIGQGLSSISGTLGDQDFSLQQSGGIQRAIDQWYRGQASGSGFGPDLLENFTNTAQRQAASQRLPL